MTREDGVGQPAHKRVRAKKLLDTLYDRSYTNRHGKTKTK